MCGYNGRIGSSLSVMCGYRYNYEGQFEALQLADAGRSCFFSDKQVAEYDPHTKATSVLGREKRRGVT